MKPIMLQGTSSDVGKSVLCTALCRIFSEDGYKVAPFKSQNMALNSYITIDGGEIGRSQGVQAEACGIEATVHMNPVLLKPKQDMVAEVVVRGKHAIDLDASEYRNDYIPKLIPLIKESLNMLANEYEIVVMEGAGSPAEINLKERDIANMKVAELADSPVILIADIDRGGMFASIVGTLALLDRTERERVKGIVINKFRGKREILDPGVEWLENYTGIPVLGILPYMEIDIEAEDSLALHATKYRRKKAEANGLTIIGIRFPHISNFTDFDPLYKETDIDIHLIQSLAEWIDPDIIILPGTKNTTDDLLWLKKTGLGSLIQQAVQNGAYVVGICGGYQMLSETLLDPQLVESVHERVDGLGLLPITTTFYEKKRTTRVKGRSINAYFDNGIEMEGYEIHLGHTERAENGFPLFKLADGSIDGTMTADGRIWGTYLHGIFHNGSFMRSWLNDIRKEKGLPIVTEPVISERERRENDFQSLAAMVRNHLDIEKVYEIMGVVT